MAKNLKETIMEATTSNQAPDSAAANMAALAGKGKMDGSDLSAMLSTDNTNKSGMMNSILSVVSGFNHTEMVDFFNKVMSQYGPNRNPGEVDNSAKNKATIKAHGAGGVVKEDLETIFASDQTLSEEFKEKASALFETAIDLALNQKIIALEEEYEEKLIQETTKLTEELTDSVDRYLTHITEQWMEDNKVAIEESLRVENTMKFIEGLKGLFLESYIDIPDERIDHVNALVKRIAELETKINEEIESTIDAKKELNKFRLQEAKREISNGMTLVEVSKFNSLIANINEEDVSEYTKKLNIIKETYFPKTSIVKENKDSMIDGVLTEEVDNGNKTVVTDPDINKFAQFISKSKMR